MSFHDDKITSHQSIKANQYFSKIAVSYPLSLPGFKIDKCMRGVLCHVSHFAPQHIPYLSIMFAFVNPSFKSSSSIPILTETNPNGSISLSTL
mmetsp:Transcript_5132/g.7592  ORF Transcript_5132/g.7592 Transcript_5132/m.7592 type:complete len:93 (+) Transcript_5132:196-474(+)